MLKLEIRSYIKTRVALRISPTEISNELKSVHGDSAPRYSCVAKWAKHFAAGRSSLEDKKRTGRPITALTKANIRRVRTVIEKNRSQSLAQIVAETSLSKTTVHRILQESLKRRSLASRWVPHQLTNLQRQKRVEACVHNLAKFTSNKWRLSEIVTGDETWVFWRQVGTKSSIRCWVGPGESPGTVVRQSRFEPKRMFTVFFKSTGYVFIDRMQVGETINARNYEEKCLKPLVAEIKRARPITGTKGMKILHENVRPHTTTAIKTYLNQEGIEIIDHPPYSPDLAPCDFRLFSHVKRQLGSHSNADTLQTQITSILLAIPPQEYLKTFQVWLHRMQLCIINDGEYFEHLIKEN